MAPAKHLLTTLMAATVWLQSSAMSEDDVRAPTSTRDDTIQALRIGAMAPRLDVAHWMAPGTRSAVPVTRFHSDLVYVLEFWGTTCGPCIRGMPHLSELQSEFHSEIRIVCITDEPPEVVQSFLNQPLADDEAPFRERVAHLTIATDPDRSVHRAYMDAAEEPGIPVTFIVGRTGTIEWIGHAADIDDPLKQVIDGQWDRDEFALEYAAVKAVRNAYYLGAVERRFDDARQRLRQLRRESDSRTVEELVSKYLGILEIFEVNRAVYEGDPRAPVLIRDHFAKRDAQAAVDWLSIVSQAAEVHEFKPDALAAMISLAIDTIEKSPDSSQLHSSLARLLERMGRLEEAIAAQEAAVLAAEAETDRLKRQLSVFREQQRAANDSVQSENK
jgi:thiol-disulfide isomerase/thioredoxin